VGKILRMERQTERKHDGVGECTPSKYRRLATTSPFVLHAAGIMRKNCRLCSRTNLHQITWFRWNFLAKLRQGEGSGKHHARVAAVKFTDLLRRITSSKPIIYHVISENRFSLNFAVYGDTCPHAASGGLIRHNTQQCTHSLPVVYTVPAHQPSHYGRSVSGPVPPPTRVDPTETDH